MKKRKLHWVIDQSKDRSALIYVRDIVLTAFVWVLYFYFMLDFFYFVGDVFNWAMGGFVNADQYPSFRIMPTIVSYLEALIVMTVLFIGWSVYNIMRFGKKRRRKFDSPVTIEQLAQTYHSPAEKIAKWQKSRIAVVHHDGRGHITDVVVEK